MLKLMGVMNEKPSLNGEAKISAWKNPKSDLPLLGLTKDLLPLT
jgi:hypothetical protein